MEHTTDLNITIVKEFNVPAERLFETWTSEEDLRQWWHPMENRLRHLTNELKPGGQIAYTFESKEGDEVFTIQGNYKEVVPGKKLVYTWNWHLPTPTVHDSDYLLTILFEPTGNGSRLEIRQEQFANEESVLPHREGWEKALSSLQSYLSKQ